MQSIYIFQKGIDINLILQEILFNPNNCAFEKVINNPNWIIDNCSGNLEPNLLEQVLCLIRKNLDLVPFACQLIDFAEAEEISDSIFNIIMTFPNKQRSDLLIPLSHKTLSERQLIILCKNNENFEPFYELAILYYTDNKYVINDFKKVITKFKHGKFQDQYCSLLEELSMCKTDDNVKRELLLKELSNAKL